MRNSTARKNLVPTPAGARVGALIVGLLFALLGSATAQQIWLGEAPIGLTKTGSGMLTPAGTNTYTAATVTSGIGAITLSSNSITDLGGDSSVIAFAKSKAQTWTGTLYNWSGNVAGIGADQLRFGTDATGLTSTQLSQIAFSSDSGTTFLGTGGYAGDLDGEVAPVPEASSWFAGALAFGALGFSLRRRMQKGAARIGSR